jgi:4'-phosphopantetheinyl transferase
VIVSALRFDTPIADAEYDSLCRIVLRERLEKVRKVFRRADRERSLLGEALLRFHLIGDFGIKESEIRFSRNKFGKPSLEGGNVLFNVSHSGVWVTCILDSEQVGIDVERIKEIDMSIAERFFSASEFSHLMKQSEAERCASFFDLWTLKESFIKAIGKGLSLSLASFSVTFAGGCPFIEHDPSLGTWFVKQYEFDPDYRLAACAQHPGFPERPAFVSLGTMLSRLG